MLQVSGVRGPVRSSVRFTVRFWGALGVFAVGLVGACSLHQDGVTPPDNRIAFPAGAVIEPSGRWMYVVNSNSDLRYNAGTVVAVDLSKVRRDDPGDSTFNDPSMVPARPSWKPCAQLDAKFLDPRYVPPADPPFGCCWDRLDPNILNCDEQEYIQRKSTVRIGSFGGRPVLQKMPSLLGGTAGERLFIPVRGNTSITFMDVSVTNGVPDDRMFSCTGNRPGPNSSQERFATCDDHWRITRDKDPVNSSGVFEPPVDQVYNLPSEGYALAVDNLAELLYVGHLRGGEISLIDLGHGDGANRPNLVKVYQNLLPADANGSEGVTSLTIKDPCNFGAVYATSRFQPVVGSFVVYGAPDTSEGRSPAIVSRGQNIFTGLSGVDTRGIEFARRKSTTADDCTKPHADPDPPDRLFILQRTPPALVAIDASTLTPFSVIEVCQGPTNLVQQLDSTGGTIALFVTCFDAGEIDVIDPWVPRVRTIVPVGRGPIATVLDPNDPTRAYVVGFGGNNIAVVHLDPAIPGNDRVIQRIGFPSVTPRETGPGQP